MVGEKLTFPIFRLREIYQLWMNAIFRRIKMALDFQKINEAAENYRADMAAFLRAMISHPSESCEEKEVVACIKAEMEKLNFDKVEVDGLGNVIGWMGDGEKIIAIDSHIDTVGIGNIDNWEQDPYKGYETDEIIYGRGGSDQEGGMASAVYGAKIHERLRPHSRRL